MPLPPIWEDGRPNVTGAWVRLQMLAYVSYHDAVGAEAFARSYDPSADYVYYHWQLTNWPPTFLLLRVGGTWELLVWGTSNGRQWAADFAAPLAVRVDPELGGKTAATFAGGADPVFSEVAPFLRDRAPFTKLTVTGHSYGSACAGIAARRFASEFGMERVEVLSAGGPRWRGGDLGGYGPAITVRYVNDDDLVPLLPPRYMTVSAVQDPRKGLRSNLQRWDHVGVRVGLGERGELTIGTDGEEEPESFLTWNTLKGFTPHYCYEYARRLRLSGPFVPQSKAIALADAFPLPWQPPTPLVGQPDPVAALDPPVSNRLYYGSSDGPISRDSLVTFEATGLAVASARVLAAANIQGLNQLEGGGHVGSGYTKVTMVFNDGTYGHAESHVVRLDIGNLAGLNIALTTLGSARIGLLGNAFAAPPYAKSAGTPQLQYMRLTDALIPRLGDPRDLTTAGYFGPPAASGGNLAEAFSSAVSLRMRGQPITGGQPKSKSLQILGAPDACFLGTRLDPARVGVGTVWGTALANYLSILIGSVFLPDWGFMGQDPSEAVYSLTSAAVVGGMWQLTFPGSNWDSRDRFRLSGANPVFNKVWEIAQVIAPGVYTLRHQPVTGHLAPTQGSAVRIATPDGSLEVFCKYTGFGLNPDGSPSIRYAKHNPGKQYLLASFGKKTKRER